MTEPAERRSPSSSRREVLIAGGAAVGGGALTWAASRWFGRGGESEALEVSGSDDAAVQQMTLPGEDRRLGLTWPAVPQRHTLLVVYELEGRDAQQVFEAAGVARDSVGVHPEDALPVTVLAAVSVAHAHALMPERCERAVGLPAFANDDAAIVRGGDLLVMVSAETLAAVHETAASVATGLGEHRVLWQEAGFRDAPTPEATTRAGIGFIDGIINPRADEELRAGVWVGGTRRDSFVVVRRMRVEPSFGRLPVGRQEAAVGRRRHDGAPLSGGAPLDEIDLLAKHPDGRPLVPVDAHARRAHPANIGRPLMLRRSYSYANSEESGLLFVAALSDAETFVLTQRRLDELDGLISHTVTTAGDCFFVPEELSVRA